jgi:hypothetical protein
LNGALEVLRLACSSGERDKMAEVDDLSCLASDKSIRDSGHCIASDALPPVAAATTERVRGGKTAVTDGPCAETKECLAGFYMIEARDLNEAILIASRIPPAGIGSIEVSPIREAPNAHRLK